jgi:hypothetical protein
MFALKALLHLLAGISGVVLVIVTLSAAIRSFVLPRNEVVRLNIWVSRSIRLLFDLATRLAKTYARRDQIMAHYAPVALVALPIAWLTILSFGYTLMYWALGVGKWERCYELSNSSMLTLGTTKTFEGGIMALAYSEAALGLLLLTLLISYLPTIYQAFSRRETTVARLELRAGAPASACALLSWLNSSGSLEDDDVQWADWEQWFVEIEESHTSLPILAFFRSPQPGRSWVTAAGLILDTANLFISALETAQSRQVELTFKAGCLALNRVYRFFDEKAGAEPTAMLPGNAPIEEASQASFARACDELQAQGLPVRADRPAAWARYQELHSRYAEALSFLAKLTVAPDLKSI